MERMAGCGPDIVSVDQRVDMRDALARIGPAFAVQVGALGGPWSGLGVQRPSSACWACDFARMFIAGWSGTWVVKGGGCPCTLWAWFGCSVQAVAGMRVLG